MKYSSDYATLESLQELQTTILALISDAQQRLDSARAIDLENNALKIEVEAQYHQTQQLMKNLTHNQDIQKVTLQEIADGGAAVREQLNQIELYAQKITSNRTLLKKDIEQFQILKKEIVELFQQLRDFQTQVSKTQQSSIAHLNQAQSVLMEAKQIAHNVQIDRNKIDTQYEDFLQNSVLTQTLKTELTLLSDRHTNLVMREKYTSYGLGVGLIITLIVAIFL